MRYLYCRACRGWFPQHLPGTKHSCVLQLARGTRYIRPSESEVEGDPYGYRATARTERFLQKWEPRDGNT